MVEDDVSRDRHRADMAEWRGELNEQFSIETSGIGVVSVLYNVKNVQTRTSSEWPADERDIPQILSTTHHLTSSHRTLIHSYQKKNDQIADQNTPSHSSCGYF